MKRQQVSNQEPPKIEFPCPDYPIKTLGVASDEFLDVVLAVMDKHAPGFNRDKLEVRASSKGKFQSYTVYITATGIEQLQAIHEDLKKHPGTRMVM